MVTKSNYDFSFTLAKIKAICILTIKTTQTILLHTEESITAWLVFKSLFPVAHVEAIQTWRTFSNVTFIASFLLKLPEGSCFWAFIIVYETWKSKPFVKWEHAIQFSLNLVVAAELCEKNPVCIVKRGRTDKAGVWNFYRKRRPKLSRF